MFQIKSTDSHMFQEQGIVDKYILDIVPTSVFGCVNHTKFLIWLVPWKSIMLSTDRETKGQMERQSKSSKTVHIKKLSGYIQGYTILNKNLISNHTYNSMT